MNKTLYTLLLLLLCCTFSQNLFATPITGAPIDSLQKTTLIPVNFTLKSGNWDDPTTWAGGVPNETPNGGVCDILAGHIITVTTASNAKCYRLMISGTLIQNGNLRIDDDPSNLNLVPVYESTLEIMEGGVFNSFGTCCPPKYPTTIVGRQTGSGTALVTVRGALTLGSNAFMSLSGRMTFNTGSSFTNGYQSSLVFKGWFDATPVNLLNIDNLTTLSLNGGGSISFPTNPIPAISNGRDFFNCAAIGGSIEYAQINYSGTNNYIGDATMRRFPRVVVNNTTQISNTSFDELNIGGTTTATNAVIKSLYLNTGSSGTSTIKGNYTLANPCYTTAPSLSILGNLGNIMTDNTTILNFNSVDSAIIAMNTALISQTYDKAFNVINGKIIVQGGILNLENATITGINTTNYFLTKKPNPNFGLGQGMGAIRLMALNGVAKKFDVGINIPNTTSNYYTPLSITSNGANTGIAVSLETFTPPSSFSAPNVQWAIAPTAVSPNLTVTFTWQGTLESSTFTTQRNSARVYRYNSGTTNWDLLANTGSVINNSDGSFSLTTSNITSSGIFAVMTLTPPPPNDNCSNAITIPFTSAWQTVTGTTESATSSGFNTCAGTPAQDVWYKILGVTAGERVEFELTGGTMTAVNFTTHVGANCTITGTCHGCSPVNTTNVQTFKSQFCGTSDYYIRIFTNGGTNGTFTLRVRKLIYEFNNAGGDALWTTHNNWQSGPPPNPLPSGETVYLALSPIVNTNYTLNGTIKRSPSSTANIVIQSGRTFTIGATGNITDDVVGDIIHIANNGTLVNNGNVSISFGNSIAAAVVQNNASLTIEKYSAGNSGIVNNNTTGTMTFKAGFSNESGGIFNNSGIVNNEMNNFTSGIHQFTNQSGSTLNNLAGGTFNQNGKFLSNLSTIINNHSLFKINAGTGVSSQYQGIFNNKSTGVLELNAVIFNSGTPTPTFNNEGTITGQGGLLQSFNFNNSGNIKPNNNGAGRITVNGGGNLRMGTGTLHIDIGGTTVTTTYDQFNANGTQATLQGNLVVNLINGFVPAVGNTFAIVVYNTNAATGTFGSVTLPNIAPNRWQTTYGASSMTLTVLGPNYVFNNSQNNKRWDEPLNWTPNGVPSTITDNATINSGFEVLLETDRTIGNLVWAGGSITAATAKTLVATVSSSLFTDNSHVIGNNVTLEARSGSFWTVGSTAPNTHTMTINGTLINRGSFLLSTTYAVNILGSGSLTNYNFINRSNVGPANITPTVYNKPTGIVVGSNDGQLCFVGNLHNEGTISGYCNGIVRILANGYLMNGTILDFKNCTDIVRISGMEVVGNLYDQTSTGFTIPAKSFIRMANSTTPPVFSISNNNVIVNNGLIGGTTNCSIIGVGSITNSSTGTIYENNDFNTSVVMTVNVPVTNNGTLITGIGDRIELPSSASYGGILTGSGTYIAATGFVLSNMLIRPGGSPGKLVLDPYVTSTVSTIYEMEITGGFGAAGIADDADRVESTGNIALNGSLRIIMNNAEPGSYTIFNSTGGMITGFNNLSVGYSVNGGDLINIQPSNVNIVVNSSSIILNITSALPIELRSFKAQVNGSKAELNWQTASEINVNNFEIEKSLDGKIFSKIAQIKANNTPSVYQAFDDLFSSSAYYRLKINDLGGMFQYSKVIFLEKNASKDIKISRNTEGSILIETNDKIELITITNSIGQLIKSSKEKQFFMNEFNAGIYIISVKTDKGFLSEKIFKN